MLIVLKKNLCSCQGSLKTKNLKFIESSILLINLKNRRLDSFRLNRSQIFLLFGKVVFSGGKRTRTADILLAKQALYQLSYTPNIEIWAILDLNQGPHPYQGCALTT